MTAGILLAVQAQGAMAQDASGPQQQAVPITIGRPPVAETPPAAAASAEQPAAPERLVRISLPAALGTGLVSPVLAEVSMTSVVAVDATSLLASLGDRLGPDVRIALETRRGQFVPVADLATLGIVAEYDPAQLLLRFSLLQAATGPQRFDISGQTYFGGGQRVAPSDLAFGLTGTLIGGRDFSDGSRSDRLLYDFLGFANVGGRDGVYLSYGGTFNLRGIQGRTFQRDRIIAFKDFEEQELRVAGGDLVPLLPVIAGDVELLGVSVERRFDALQPLRNVRPTGRRSFVLERPARIEIYADGALLQTINADAGPVDLNQIASLSLTSDVSIVIEDTAGRRELDSFTLSNDIELLDAGLNEFTFAVGALRRPVGFGFNYSDDPVATGEFSQGLAGGLTAGGHFIVAEDYQNVGGRLAALALRGAVFSGFSLSRTGGQTGYAGTLAYRGNPLASAYLDGQLNFRADYQSRGYRRLSLFQFANNTKWDIAADYRFGVSRRVSLSFGGNYFERYGVADTSRSVFAGVQTNFGRFLLSTTARYARFGQRSDAGVLAVLTMPIGRRHFSSLSHDTISDTTRFEVRRLRDFTVPEFDYSVVGTRGPTQSRLTGQTRFANSRFDLDVDFTTIDGRGVFAGQRENLGQFRLQSGFAFADGRFGIGRNPGRGFIMVDRHRSLRNSVVEVDTAGASGRGVQANDFGPAVVTQTTGYRPEVVRVNVLDAPPGYDIGAGEFVTEPGALSGVRITIGSDAYRTAIITLQTPDGNPIALQYGTIRGADDQNPTSFFTNSNGRAVLTRLAPGDYIVELFDGELTYRLTVAEDAPAMIEAGTQRMELEQ